jgi:hypothetical protein
MASIEIDGVNGVIKSTVSDADLTIKGNDGGSEISAVTFDMSDAGTAVFNHDIKLANDQKAIFGTASNLEIYADSINSYIKETGSSGNLQIIGNTVRLQSASDEIMLEATNDAGVDIRHNHVTKLLTTASGVDITGGFTATSASTITVSDNSDTLKLVSTDDDGSSGPVLHMVRDSASPADGDSLGRIHFSADNDAGEEEIFARIKVAIIDASDGSEDANMRFSRMTGGGDQNVLSFESTESVFNDDSKDIDFRVESDGDANAFFVDAANNRVGFFTNSPDNQIDLKRSGNAVMKIESTNNGDDAKLLVKKAGSASRNMVVFQSSNSWHVGHLRNATSTFSIATQDDSGSSNEFRVTTTGITVAGTVTKTSSTFNIEHPHPDKKDTHRLVHSVIEAPKADLIYRGKVDLVDGSATVNIDTVSGMTEGTFVLLNTDVQCFTSNETGWTAVKGSVSENTLTITAEDNSCTDNISWMVVGERHDQAIKNANITDDDGKVIVEPLKEVEEDA